MSVAIAITVTLPGSTAAKVKAVGLDFSQSIGAEVARLIENQFVQGTGVSVDSLGAVTVSTTVT